MIAAVIVLATHLVANVVVADPLTDRFQEVGTILIAVPPDLPVTIGWIYDPATNTFKNPNPTPDPAPAPPQPTLADLQAQLAELTAKINAFPTP